MEENGDEKLLAVARHIAKTLGRTDTMTDDILQIFSAFDGRLSKVTESLAAGDAPVEHHHHPRPTTAAAFEQALRSLDRRISRFVAADRPLWSDSADSAAFLDSVDELLALLRDSAEERPAAPAGLLDRAEDLLQQAMFRLEDEFRTLMERGGESFDSFAAPARPETFSDSEEDDGELVIPVANPIPDYDFVIDALPSGTVADLHDIAKRMVAAGYGKECGHVYGGCRREFLEESLSRLGLERRSIEEVQKTAWSQLEDDIDKWIKAANMALKVFFPSERRLVDRIFGSIASPPPHSFADSTFMEVCRGAAIQILAFADAVAIGSRAPERLFRVLDLFETMRDLMPDFNLVFSDHYCAALRAEAATIWKRLGEAIRGIFMELENLIKRDPAKVAVPGGGLHPITRYVMNYLRAACGSKQTLEQVLGGRSGEGEFDNVGSGSGSSLGVEISWIMELLESNLEVKSKTHSDPALSAIFLMNNNRYIVQKARDGDLGAVLGEDWVRKHAAKVRQYHVVYQRASWGRVLAALKFEGSGNGSGGSSNSGSGPGRVARERLKQFNAGFEEVCRAQREWVVVDEQLREELRISVAGNLLPAYRNFLGRLQSMGEGVGRHGDKYMKYSVEDVEVKVNELFQGRR